MNHFMSKPKADCAQHEPGDGGAGLQVGEGRASAVVAAVGADRAHLSPAVIQTHIFMTKA